MPFLQPCFIQKCNKYIINNLINMGYKQIGKSEHSFGILCNNGKFKICSTNEQPSSKDKNIIQCYFNDELFLALAALRNDTDKKQWFIHDYQYQKVWIFSDMEHYGDELFAHKATVDEIIEHFKKPKSNLYYGDDDSRAE